MEETVGYRPFKRPCPIGGQPAIKGVTLIRNRLATYWGR